jgi:hypothetical protein
MKNNLSLLFTILFILNSIKGLGQAITMTTAMPIGSAIGLQLAVDGGPQSTLVTIPVDFGDGIIVGYTVGVSPTGISGILVGSQTIKIYEPGTEHNKIFYLCCSGNGLTALDITNSYITWLLCNDNQLTTLNIAKIYYLNCQNNKFNFFTLPLNVLSTSTYYAPQKPMPIATDIITGTVLDLSSQYSVNGNITTYTWKTETGLTLQEGTDYTITEGKTIFLLPQAENVYCEMTNATFPDFTGINVLKTTYTKVSTGTAFEDRDKRGIELYTHNKTLYINMPYNAQLSVYKADGRLILLKPITQRAHNFPLHNNGIYIVKIIGNKEAIARKVIVE